MATENHQRPAAPSNESGPAPPAESREHELLAAIARLRESEQQYRTIFENTGTISIVFDQDTTITMVNSDFARRMGYSKEEVEGKRSWTEFVVPGDLERLLHWHALRSADPASAPRNQEFRVTNRAGEVLNIFMTIDMIPGTTLRIASLMDVTDRIRAEDELLRISERERQTIGQDLHDDLAPHLMGIEFLTKILLADLEKGASPHASRVATIRDLIQAAIDKTRGFARGLCPVVLMEHGLESSLQELAQSTETIYGTRCAFSYTNPVIEHDITTSTHLFRIAQEALHNAVKHGAARTIAIDLRFDGDTTVLTVSDDGRGFDTARAGAGMGLKIMGYRCRIIGARLAVDSGPGAGTTVRVSLAGGSAPDEAP